MSDNYIQDILRRVTAQVCQTIGYNASQTTPLELLQDVLHKYLQEFARDLRRQVEHYNRDEANTDDVMLTLNNLNINVHELYDYINNVEPVQSCADVPKLPAHKDTKLNFLKPGSKEVLLRPMHVYEYLPPMLPPEDNEQYSNAAKTVGDELELSGKTGQMDGGSAIIDTLVTKTEENNFPSVNGQSSTALTITPATGGVVAIPKTPSGISQVPAIATFLTSTNAAATGGIASLRYDEEGRPTREIQSVVMTTGGFISPAIEGKLPDTIIPSLIEKLRGLDAPPPPSPPPLQHVAPAKHADPHTNRKGDGVDNVLEGTTTSGRNSKTASKISHTASPIMGGATGESRSAAAAAVGTDGLEEQNWPLGYKTQLHKTQSPSTTFVSKLLKKAKKKMPGGVPFGALSGNLNNKLQKLNAIKLDSANMSGRSGSGRAQFPPPDGNHKSFLKTLRKLAQSNKGAIDMSGNVMLPTPLSHDLENLASTSACSSMALPHLKSSTDMASALFSADNANLAANATQFNKLLKKQNKKRQKKLRQQQQQHDLSGELHKQQQQQLNSPMAHMLTSAATAEPVTALAGKMDAMSRSANFLMPGGAFGATSQNDMQTPKLFANLNSQAVSGGSTIADTSGDEPQKQALTNTNMEIKLSNEPDRSKLNIFKKISKPKSGNKSTTHSPHSHTELSASASAATNATPTLYDSQLSGTKINLPSGTTITPALPAQLSVNAMMTDKTMMNAGTSITTAAEQSMIGFDDQRSLNPYGTDMKKMNMLDSSMSLATDATDAAAARANLNFDMRNKPKKRGRKPGCRNSNKHAMKTANLELNASLNGNVGATKPTPTTTTAIPGTAATPQMPSMQMKKSKKLKMNKMCAMTGPSGAGVGMLAATAAHQLMNITKPLNLSTMDSKMISGSSNSGKGSIAYSNAKGTAQTGGGKKMQQSPLSKKMKLSPTVSAILSGGPTKEEVNSINRKLMRMDTVLKPLTTLTASGDVVINADVDNPSMYKTQSADGHHSSSPTKKSRTSMPIATACNTTSLLSAAAADVVAARMASAGGGSAAGTATVPGSLANLPPQMLLPLYTFSPRPGLIPSAPNLLGAGGGSGGGGMLLPSFLPYPAGSSTLLASSKMGVGGNDDSKRDFNDAELKLTPTIDEERNYCNVAPLVPESMKLTLGGGSRSSSSNIGIDHGERHGGFKSDSSMRIMPSKLMADEPIEVSDDSRDGSTPTPTTSAQFISNASAKNKMNPMMMPPSALRVAGDLALGKEGKDASKGADSSSNGNKSLKKMKKIAKSNKRNMAAAASSSDGASDANLLGSSSSAVPLTATDVFRLTSGGNLKGRLNSGGGGGQCGGNVGVALDAGISKLAGGADLIPIGSDGNVSSNQSLLLGFAKDLDYGMSITPTTTATLHTAASSSSSSSAVAAASTGGGGGAGASSLTASISDAATASSSHLYGSFNTKKSLIAGNASAAKSAHALYDGSSGVSGATGATVSSTNLDVIDLHESKKQQQLDMQKQKRKEHKKLKKVMKDSRLKKKKDKKDKNRSKEKYLLQHKLCKTATSTGMSSLVNATAGGGASAAAATGATTSTTDKTLAYGKFDYASNMTALGGAVDSGHCNATPLLADGNSLLQTTTLAKDKELLKKLKKEKKKLKQKQHELLHSAGTGDGGASNKTPNTSSLLTANLNLSSTNISSNNILNTTDITSSTTDNTQSMQPLLLPKLTLKFNNRSRSNSQSPTPVVQTLTTTATTTATTPATAATGKGATAAAATAAHIADAVDASSGGGGGSGGGSGGGAGCSSNVKSSSTTALTAGASINQMQQHQSSNVTQSADKQQREQSPELAKISPLVTRPPKQKAIPQTLDNVMTTTALGFACDSTLASHDNGINNSNNNNNSSSSSSNNNSSSNSSSSNNNAKGNISGSAGNSGIGNTSHKSNFAASQHHHHRHHTSIVPPPSPWQSGGTLTASSVLLPQQLLQAAAAAVVNTSSNVNSGSATAFSSAPTATTIKSKHNYTTDEASTSSVITATQTVPSTSLPQLPQSQANADGSNATPGAAVTAATAASTAGGAVSASTPLSGGAILPNVVNEGNRPSSYIDAEGNRVWICPACGKVDDGSAMIGCDDCDAWYHWICVGIVVEPKDNEDWFCRVCITRRKGMHGEKKRKRNKKK